MAAGESRGWKGTTTHVPRQDGRAEADGKVEVPTLTTAERGVRRGSEGRVNWKKKEKREERNRTHV